MSEMLRSPWLTVRVQIALGVIFVAAALPKIVDPPAFAQMIYNYRLVPGFAVNALALVLPWLELLAGLALILGIWRRSAAALVGAMLVAFIVAIGINLARGHAVDCGCFAVDAVAKTPAQLFDEMRWVVIRDIGMLLMVAQIVWATRQPRAETEAAEALEPAQAHRT
ncbi:MAG TPA: MauE/DoxX family redox-associated membrane protein [Thermoanaerobaculia bacterium]|nr:MauE/DoxX family redox-associated membrane protein [Thermoanaerobaculia bacterium]